MLQAELGPNGVGAARIAPVYLDPDGRPEVVRGTAAQASLERLRTISAKRGTTIAMKSDVAEVVP